MASLGSILSIASTALRAQQKATDVVAHNIANATTKGYSRQRAVLSPRPPLQTPEGVFGTGVSIVDVARVRDSFLDAAFRRQVGSARDSEVRSGILERLEGRVVEPSDGGIAAALDGFLAAWSALATDPASTVVRTTVLDRGDALARRLREAAGGIDRLRQDTESRLLGAVERTNALAEEIARLNKEIVAAESGGLTAGDARDARDRALDELAALLPVQVREQSRGAVGVSVAGVSLVDGVRAGVLEVRTSGGTVGIGLQGRPGTLAVDGGAVAGMLRVLNADLPGTRARLDDLAEALVTAVNSLHSTGTTPDGSTGVDFFDPTGTLASTIDLSAAVAGDPQAVAAGTGGTAGEYRAGANDVALALAALRDTDVASLGTTLAEHYRETVTGVGSALAEARRLAEVHGTLAEQADTRRSSVSGVSTDEELVRLIEFQTAYAAAARVVTTADEMIETLLRI